MLDTLTTEQRNYLSQNHPHLMQIYNVAPQIEREKKWDPIISEIFGPSGHGSLTVSAGLDPGTFPSYVGTGKFPSYMFPSVSECRYSDQCQQSRKHIEELNNTVQAQMEESIKLLNELKVDIKNTTEALAELIKLGGSAL